MAFRKIFSTRSLVLNRFKDRKVLSIRGVKTTVPEFEEAKLQARTEIKPEWERALGEAEKCVGHQASFLGLRSITNYDETNWGEHMNRLEGSNHPMHEAAR